LIEEIELAVRFLMPGCDATEGAGLTGGLAAGPLAVRAAAPIAGLADTGALLTSPEMEARGRAAPPVTDAALDVADSAGETTAARDVAGLTVGFALVEADKALLTAPGIAGFEAANDARRAATDPGAGAGAVPGAGRVNGVGLVGTVFLSVEAGGGFVAVDAPSLDLTVVAAVTGYIFKRRVE